MKKIITQEKKLLRAELFDTVEQRPVSVENFTAALSFKNRVYLTNKDYGLVIPVDIVAEDDGECRVTIPAGGVVEQRGIRYRVMQLSVLPDLLQSRVGAEGAFMLPVFSGMKVDFRERPPQVNIDRIYLEQREWEKISAFNCFALIRPEKSVLAVVESGDFNCRVISEYNQDGVNRIYARFDLRDDPAAMLKCEDKTIRFLDAGAGADYPELAILYRETLRSRGMTTLKERMAGNPVLEYSADALRMKIFMAAKEPYVPDGSSPVSVFATFDEACEIVDAVHNAGFDKAVITLVGWNLGGHDGAWPTAFPVEPALGGEAGLRKLIAHAKKYGYQIVPHCNVTDSYRNSPDFDYEFVARNRAQEPLASGIWAGGQAYKMCPTVYLRRYGYELERIRELGFEGHFYLDAQATVMWKCYDPRHPADEREFALALSAITSVPRTDYGAVAVEIGTSYILPYVDEVMRIDAPLESSWKLDICPASFRALEPRAVPFYHIALHGLVLHQTDWVHGYGKKLRLGQLYELATGSRPTMEVSYRTDGGNGGDYKECIAKLRDAYRWCYKELRVQTELVREFSEPVEGYYRVVYENGVGIRVNTTRKTVDGLAPESWERLAPGEPRIIPMPSGDDDLASMAK